MDIKKLCKCNKTTIVLALLTLVVGVLLGGAIGCLIQQKRLVEEVARVTAEIEEREQKKLDSIRRRNETSDDKVEEMPWYLELVNSDNPMKEGYVPELVELESGYSVDSRIADAARKMLSDAEEEGMSIVICSAYRSVERQEKVFNDSMRDRLNEGMEYLEAYRDTATNVALPGTSEHALGLALDLISNQYAELDERQEGTKEAKWLAENCHKYGFVLRYPPEKTEITGIIYEPWHYRYVGVEDATKIMEMDLTLEEYLNEYYEP